MRIVLAESFRSSGIVIGSSRPIIISEVSIAISVDLLPRDIPTSAYESAGASFMPSPTIITVFPPACSFSTDCAFCSGRSSARKLSAPIASQTALACSVISPVSSSMSPTPSNLREFTARRTFSLGLSAESSTHASTSSIPTYEAIAPSLSGS